MVALTSSRKAVILVVTRTIGETEQMRRVCGEVPQMCPIYC
jgi:hypothetical protein